MRRAPTLTPVYFFSSLSEGSGKATLLSNLAIYLNNRNQKIAIIDLDASNPKNIVSSFPNSIELREYYELSQLVTGSKSRFHKSFYFTDTELISYFPSQTTVDLNDFFNDTEFRDYFLQLRSTFDFVFINLSAGKHNSLKVSELLARKELWNEERPVSIIVSKSDVNSIVEADKLFREFAAFSYQTRENTIIVFNRVFSGSNSEDQTADNLNANEIRSIFSGATNYIIPQNAEFPMQSMQPVPFVLQNDTITSQIISSLYRLISSSNDSTIRSFFQRESSFKECTSGAMYNLIKPYSEDIYNAISSIFFIVSINYQIYIEESDNSYAIRIRLSEQTDEHFNIYDDEKQYEKFKPVSHDSPEKFVFPECILQKKYKDFTINQTPSVKKIYSEKIYSFDDTSLISSDKRIIRYIDYDISRQTVPSPIIFTHENMFSDIPSLSNLLGIKRNLRKQYQAPRYANKEKHKIISGINPFEIPTEFNFSFTANAKFIPHYLFNNLNSIKIIGHNTKAITERINEYFNPYLKKTINMVCTNSREITIKALPNNEPQDFIFKLKDKKEKAFIPSYPEIIGLSTINYSTRQYENNNLSTSYILCASLLTLSFKRFSTISPVISYISTFKYREVFIPSRFIIQYEPYCENFACLNKLTDLQMLINDDKLEVKSQNETIKSVIRRNSTTASEILFGKIVLRPIKAQKTRTKHINIPELFLCELTNNDCSAKVLGFCNNKIPNNFAYTYNDIFCPIKSIHAPKYVLQPDLTEKTIYKMDTFKTNFASSNTKIIDVKYLQSNAIFKLKSYEAYCEMPMSCTSLMSLAVKNNPLKEKSETNNFIIPLNIVTLKNEQFNFIDVLSINEYIYTKKENVIILNTDTPDKLSILQRSVMDIENETNSNFQELEVCYKDLAYKYSNIALQSLYTFDKTSNCFNFKFSLKDIKNSIIRPNLIIRSIKGLPNKGISIAIMPTLRRKYTRIDFNPYVFCDIPNDFIFTLCDKSRLVPYKSLCLPKDIKKDNYFERFDLIQKIKNFNLKTTRKQLPLRTLTASISNRMMNKSKEMAIIKINGLKTITEQNSLNSDIRFFINTNQISPCIASPSLSKPCALQKISNYSNSRKISLSNPVFQPIIPSLLENIYTVAVWISKTKLSNIQYAEKEKSLKSTNTKTILRFQFKCPTLPSNELAFLDRAFIKASDLSLPKIRKQYEINKVDRKSLLKWAKETTNSFRISKKASS